MWETSPDVHESGVHCGGDTRGPVVEVMGVQASWATSGKWEEVCKSMGEECAGAWEHLRNKMEV